MTANRSETRRARYLQTRLNISYTHALRLHREAYQYCKDNNRMYHVGLEEYLQMKGL